MSTPSAAASIHRPEHLTWNRVGSIPAPAGHVGFRRGTLLYIAALAFGGLRPPSGIRPCRTYGCTERDEGSGRPSARHGDQAETGYPGCSRTYGSACGQAPELRSVFRVSKQGTLDPRKVVASHGGPRRPFPYATRHQACGTVNWDGRLNYTVTSPRRCDNLDPNSRDATEVPL